VQEIGKLKMWEAVTDLPAYCSDEELRMCALGRSHIRRSETFLVKKQVNV
jgi:hypothetical protein